MESWAVRVKRQSGEMRRQELILDGRLDRSLRPKTDGLDLLLPVYTSPPGTERAVFSSCKAQADLPRHEQVGGIAIMQENDPEGAEEVLAARPSTHTVLYSDGAVEGEFRTKSFMILAGVPTTQTLCIEFGHRYTIDLSTAYFSSRLATERHRIRSLLHEGEVICDMFCGVGPFSIILADRAAWVLACDKNPSAVHLLHQNVAANKVPNILPILGDARHLGAFFPATFDRVIMNLPFTAIEFLSVAERITRDGGIIHLYVLEEQQGEYTNQIRSIIPESTITVRFLRSYSAGRWHAVYDIKKR